MVLGVLGVEAGVGERGRDLPDQGDPGVVSHLLGEKELH